jgi:hypothetical protein
MNIQEDSKFKRFLAAISIRELFLFQSYLFVAYPLDHKLKLCLNLAHILPLPLTDLLFLAVHC